MTAIRITWVVLASVGCASPMASLREDNHRLTQNVAELRADRRAQDRKIRDLEHQLALAKDRSTGEEPAVPPLPVEVVAPPAPPPPADGERVVGVADDGGEVIYEGDAAAGKPATLDDDAPHRASAPAPAPRALDDSIPVASDHLEVTHRVPPVSARAAHAHVRAPDPAAGDAGAEYRAAVDLVKAGKYDDAVTALHAFLAHYPRHDYADNAQYWIGESYYAQRDYAHALVEFRATIETYPRGNKVPDALLKVGYCYQALGQADKARAVLEQVVTLYPKSEPAALAAQRLELR
ncbi:MAG TPA: tol-pal system protein YbgF [Kofleriaceae bacterium]|nr:tol-pal system protein YbgF [Kofleriaceae bacterium]